MGGARDGRGQVRACCECSVPSLISNDANELKLKFTLPN